MPSLSSWKEVVEVAVKAAREQHLGDAGEVIVITAGMPWGASGSTNILRVATL
jgi:pyruvate kinase